MAKTKFSEKWKSSQINETLNKIKQRPSSLWYSLLFDVLFFSLLFVLDLVFNNPLSQTAQSNFFERLTFVLLFLLIYTFTKFMVLEFTKSSFRNEKSNPKTNYLKLSGLFLLNIFLFLTLFLVLLSVVIFITLLSDPSTVLDNAAIAMIFLIILFYPVANLAHCIFSLENKASSKYFGSGSWSSYKQAWKLFFIKPKTYLMPYFLLVFDILVVGLILTLVDIVLKWALNEQSLAVIYSNYLSLVASAAFTLIYVVHVFNRFYFMNAVQKDINSKHKSEQSKG